MLPILIYAAVAVFLVGNLYRFIRIARMPIHLRWELYPVPHEPRRKARYGGSYMEEDDWWTKSMHTNRVGELGVMLPEIFLLKGVWEHNRPLWFWSWLMHIGLYLLVAAVALTIVGALLGIGEPLAAANLLGLEKLIFELTVIICWIAFPVGILGGLGVLAMRLFSAKLSPFTSMGAVFNLMLILGLFGLGLGSLVLVKDAPLQMFGLTQRLLTFRELPPVNGMVAAYTAVLALFMLYFPFTHMTHAFMKYMTYHSVRWDDAPLVKTDKLNRKINEALHYPVSWSAPHIRGDGKKTWLDVATEELKKNG